MNRRLGQFVPVHRRHGFTMAELLVASALLGTVFTLSIPLLGHVRSMQLEIERRTDATQAMANLMEHVAGLAASNRLQEVSAATLTLPDELQRQLPESELVVASERMNGDVSVQRVTLQISWLNDAGVRGSPVELTAWFPVREAVP